MLAYSAKIFYRNSEKFTSVYKSKRKFIYNTIRCEAMRIDGFSSTVNIVDENPLHKTTVSVVCGKRAQLIAAH